MMLLTYGPSVRRNIVKSLTRAISLRLSSTYSKYDFLNELGIDKTNKGCFNGEEWISSGEVVPSINPTTNEVIANVQHGTVNDYNTCIDNMNEAQAEWSSLPMPARGQVIRSMGEAFRKHKVSLGKLITLEMGKIQAEGEGEVQEIIDICDYACGLSRCIGGLNLPSERPGKQILFL